MNRSGTPGSPATPDKPRRPTLRQRFVRHPPGIRFWAGTAILAFYAGVGVSAVFVFGNSLGTLPFNYPWAAGSYIIGPSSAHPFGVISGFGTGLLEAIWQATPWDLAMVAGILSIDATLGWFVGAAAGLRPGGWVDRLLMFLCDSIGAIPSVLLVAVTCFATLWFAHPTPAQDFPPTSWGYAAMPIFVVVFGVVLWPRMARAVRDRAQFVASSVYVEASRASGASTRRILLRQVMPNSLGPVLAQVPLDTAPVFFFLSIGPWLATCGEAGAGPPGVGYVVPALPLVTPLPSASFPEWGYLLAVGACEGLGPAAGALYNYWWMYFFPLLAILVLGLGIGLFCDGIDRWWRLRV